MPTAKSNGKLTSFICKDTGIELKIRKIPIILTRQLARQYEHDCPPPKPPVQSIDYGDGEKVEEPNISHPSYLRLLQEYNLKRNEDIEERIRHLFADLAIECEIDKDEVKRFREASKLVGVELDPNDKYVYIWNIAIGTQDGYAELMQAIQLRIQPVKEEIESAKDSFRGQDSQ